MQTFVPYGADFEANAGALDMKRLGKQRVEGLQILNTLTGRSNGWKNHPAVKMWLGHTAALGQYTLEICNRWINLGYKDTCKEKVLTIIEDIDDMVILPGWLNDREVAVSHRSNLIRKFPEHYGLIWPDVPADLPYKWPVQ